MAKKRMIVALQIESVRFFLSSLRAFTPVNNIFMGIMRRVGRFLASLQLAVLVLVALAILIAWGTFVESRYQDAWRAKIEVYQSWPMMVVMGILALNLTAVMVDRWPWKRRHLSFLLAHIGILILLAGAFLTSQWGLDGIMRIEINQSNRWVYVPETEVSIWSSFDGDKFSRIFHESIDFYKDKHWLGRSIPLDQGSLQFVEWQAYAISSRKIRRSSAKHAGSAIQFTLKNDRVQVTEWLLRAHSSLRVASFDFGPAQVHWGKDQGPSFPVRNEIYIFESGNQKMPLGYVIYSAAEKHPVKKGVFRPGQAVDTGWMGLQLEVVQYLPQAEEVYDLQFLSHKTDLTQPALRVRFQERDYWVLQNDVVKMFTDNGVYILSFGQKRIDIGFNLELKEFRMDTYPGTRRPATYQSLVRTPEGQEIWISMNEPLKYKELTFYQASYQQAPSGAVIASIFSVNYDPGRWLKYLGSFILSVGIIILFYDRRKKTQQQIAPHLQTGD